jgi:hypothetical protein
MCPLSLLINPKSEIGSLVGVRIKVGNGNLNIQKNEYKILERC